MHNLRRIHHNLRVGRMVSEGEAALEENIESSDEKESSENEDESSNTEDSFAQRVWDKITGIF